MIHRLIKRIRVLGGERGTTLIELLVVVLAGTVVTAALFALLELTLHQTSKTFTSVDATQRSRTLFETIDNELHSACVADGSAPIQATGGAGGATGDNTVIFLSQYGNAASVTPVEHQIDFNAGAQTITDTTFAVNGGGTPAWTFSTTPSSTRTLLTNVAQSGSTPVFQYFAYQQLSYTDGAGNAYVLLPDGTSPVPGTTTIPPVAPLATPLSAANAVLAVEVLITLSVGPGGGTGENSSIGHPFDPVTNSVVLRITPAANHAGANISFLPCQ